MNYNFNDWWISVGKEKAALLESYTDIEALCKEAFMQAHKTLPNPSQIYASFIKNPKLDDPEWESKREQLQEDAMEYEGFYK